MAAPSVAGGQGAEEELWRQDQRVQSEEASSSSVDDSLLDDEDGVDQEEQEDEHAQGHRHRQQVGLSVKSH